MSDSPFLVGTDSAVELEESMKTYGRVRFTVAARMRAADASPAAAGTDGDVVFGADHFGATPRTAIIANLAETEVAGFFNDASTGAAACGDGRRS